MSLKESLLSTNKDSLKNYGSTIKINDYIKEYNHFYVNNGSNIDYKQDMIFSSNYVRTNRYTWYTFIPKNLYEQFCNIANLYFLLIGMLQIFPSITTTDGIPTMYESLGFIIFVGMIRAGTEDYHRHKADTKRNKSKYLKFINGTFNLVESGTIKPGDILKIKNDSNDTS